MDILKRNIAPISKEAWQEIDNKSIEVIKNIITTRKVLKVNGPKGWNFTAVPIGRLEILDKGDEGNICTGIFKTQNLVEARIEFELDKFELDNIQRGSKDIDLSNLEKAVEKLVLFEETAIYNGYDEGNIEGLKKSAGHRFELGINGGEMLKVIGKAIYKLLNSYVEGPFDLIVSPEVYDKMNIIYEGVFLRTAIEKIIQGKIIRSKILEGAILIPTRNLDLELTIGQDFSIGFVENLKDTVKLYAIETFTFRILDNNKVVSFNI